MCAPVAVDDGPRREGVDRRSRRRVREREDRVGEQVGRRLGHVPRLSGHNALDRDAPLVVGHVLQEDGEQYTQIPGTLWWGVTRTAV